MVRIHILNSVFSLKGPNNEGSRYSLSLILTVAIGVLGFEATL